MKTMMRSQTHGKMANTVRYNRMNDSCPLMVNLDVTPVDVVKCDVSAILDHDLRVPLSQQRQNDLEIGPFRCHFQLSANFLEVQVLHKRTVLAGCEIPTRADAKRNSTRNEWG